MFLRSNHPTIPGLNEQRCVKKKLYPSIIILLIFAAGFGIRLYHIDRPPLDFSPIRQFQNAHIIRGLYYEKNDAVSDSKKQIARLNMERMGFVLEPRIIENAAILGYRIIGGERLWIPRTLSSVFWIIGGFFLYLTARTIFPPGISLFSTAFYLFLPYAILSSRIIQPDPLMVMLMLAGIYLVMKYDEKQSVPFLVLAAAISAVAVLVKPYCIFIIVGAFVSLRYLRRGFIRSFLNRDTIVFCIIIILPSVIHYIGGLLSGSGFYGEHVKGSFMPQLVLYPQFWTGWITMISEVVGYAAFLFAILGTLKIVGGRPGTLLIGLWAGYFLFGLSATYQIHTHNYYSMPLIPIVALSLGPVVDITSSRLRSLVSGHYRKPVLMIAIPVIILAGVWIFMSPLKNKLADHKNGLKTLAVIVGINPEFRKFLFDDFKKETRVAEEIGEHVGHSTNTLFLSPYFGRVEAYYGEFAGLPWPISQSLHERRMRGLSVPNIKQDFTSKSVKLLYQGKFIEYEPDFFIVTAFDEFEKQGELKDFMNSHFPVLIQTDDYLIFDLRGMFK